MINQQSWVVAKFGGTSVSSVESIQNMIAIVKNYSQQNKRVLVVVSAISGVSNLLEELCWASVAGEVENIVFDIKTKHLDLMTNLNLLDDDLNQFLELRMKKLKSKVGLLLEANAPTKFIHQAAIMSEGEKLSSAILHKEIAKQLKEEVVLTPAENWLMSEHSNHRTLADQYLNAECRVEYDPVKAKKLNELGSIVITQGFIAKNSIDDVVVLGRGGSDTSAAYFATLIRACQLDIWTDVPGMFSANPKEISEARQLVKLDYQEAQEIASTGAKVLHPRCLRPARQSNIPVFVGSTFAPEKGGTFIHSYVEPVPQIKAISVRNKVTLISMETLDMWQTPGFLVDAFQVFYQLGLSIDQISTSETNVTVTLDNLTQGISAEQLDRVKQELSRFCRVSILENCAAVSVVGHSVRTLLSQISRAFEAFQNRELYMLTQAANNLNLTFVIVQSEAPQLIQQIHDVLISQFGEVGALGKTWMEIFEAQSDPMLEFARNTWWLQKRETLIQLSRQNGPCYVYSLSKVNEQLRKLNELKSIDKVFYAIKANSHPSILQQVEMAGFGFECVSIYEVDFILKLFPGIDPSRILFTPNFANRDEYEQAIARKVHLTLDNDYPLYHWPEVFEGQSLFLRIDTGIGQGHHHHVKTAGREAKFGIPIDSISQLSKDIQLKNINVTGLHCHVGSGILTSDNWSENGAKLAQLAEHFPNLKYIDLGGGLGIVDRSTQVELNLSEVNKNIGRLKASLENIEFWLEPGRYIVAESGVLLTQVTQLKGKSGAQYLGVDTGMNSLIRPALYGAYHPIINLNRFGDTKIETYTVVGPICESADKLGVDRILPRSYEGDVILIANSGAYGAVMSSQYNMRKPAKELVIS